MLSVGPVLECFSVLNSSLLHVCSCKPNAIYRKAKYLTFSNSVFDRHIYCRVVVLIYNVVVKM